MTTERIRTTISLTPEALAVFKRMADAANLSVSRCMGDWLVDTCEAAEMLTTKMEEAKRAPLRVMREMRAMVAGMDSMVDEIEDEVRGHRSERRASGARAGGPAPKPPSSNTGVLVPPVPSNSPAFRKSKVVLK
jgi:hypothetical protein